MPRRHELLGPGTSCRTRRQIGEFGPGPEELQRVRIGQRFDVFHRLVVHDIAHRQSTILPGLVRGMSSTCTTRAGTSRGAVLSRICLFSPWRPGDGHRRRHLPLPVGGECGLQPVHRVVPIFGIAWMSDTFVKRQAVTLTSMLPFGLARGLSPRLLPVLMPSNQPARRRLDRFSLSQATSSWQRGMRTRASPRVLRAIAVSWLA